MDKADFAARVYDCERKLYRVARTILRSDADCEDAVQEAILRAWEHRYSLREACYFDTWLIRILINECRALLRRQMRSGGEIPESLAAPERSAGLEELMQLPEKYRVPIELHYIEGYALHEIAGMMRLPEGTVKWRLSRGRKLLEGLLNEEESV